MKTVIILAEALSKAAFSPIERLDIHLIRKSEEEAFYSARLWLADDRTFNNTKKDYFDINEDGTITKGSM